MNDRVRMVALDANYFRTIQVPEINALRARGFVLSVSIFTVSEVWTHALRKNNPGLFFVPIKRVLPLLDSAHPVLLGGAHITWALEPMSVRERERRQAANRAEGRRVRDSLLLPFALGAFEGIGAVLQKEIDEHGRGWTETRERARRGEFLGMEDVSEEELRRQVEETSEEDLRRDLLPRLIQQVEPPFPERFDAYWKLASLTAVRAAKNVPQKKPEDNDAEDLALLQHFAHPAFVASWDLEFITAVDASDTYQRPWLRTLGELLNDPLPKGLPWGKSAAKAAAMFRRRSRHELNALEHATRTALRRPQPT